MTYAAESAAQWSELATKFQSLADGAGGWQLKAFAPHGGNESQDVVQWSVDDANSLHEQFKLHAAEAARALGGVLRGTSLLNMWLHRVYQYLCDKSSPLKKPSVPSTENGDGTEVRVERPGIHEVCKASTAFCLSLQRQALEGELTRETLAQRFPAWIVENSSAPEFFYWESTRPVREWISSVARCARTSIPIDFLSDRLNIFRLPQRTAEFGSLRALFDHVARQEGLMWCITERGLWMALEPPTGEVYIDSKGRQHGRVRIDETNAVFPKSGFTPSGDYQTIEFGGKRYQLTRLAAEIVRVLHAAQLKNAGGLSTKQLRKETGCTNVWDAFRRQDGRAFKKEVIRKLANDVYGLALE